MKKTLSIVLRLLLAVAGVGYIAWTLSWHDQVLIPAGYQLTDGKTLEQPVALRVLSADGQGGYRLLGPEGTGEVRVVIDSETIRADQPRFKPGIVSMIKGADYGLLLVGLLLLVPVFPIQAFRWWLLMRCRGMRVPYAKAMRLTMVGLFFNFCMPGMTGGDVVKAYYAAKGSGARGIAVMSVIFDRVAGLLGLVLLAGLAGIVLLMRGGLNDADRLLVTEVTALIWLGFGCVVMGAGLYFSRHVRRWLGLDRLIRRWGPENLIVRIDDAAATYREHKRWIVLAVLVSLPVHFCQALATSCAGWALGMGLSAGIMLTVLPVVFLAGSVPLTYQGLGVMEALAVAMLLPSPDADANQLVSMLVLIRVYLILYALIGALLVLRGNMYLFPQGLDADPNESAQASASSS